MKKQTWRWHVFVVLLAFISLSSILLAGGNNTRAAYDHYLAAFNSYKAAITRKAPEAEVRKALANYKAAKKAYEANFQSDFANNQTAANTSSAQTSPNNTQEPVLVIPTGSNVTTNRFDPQLPQTLKNILQRLWSEKGRSNPDQAIAQLKRFIRQNPRSPFVNAAKYELAKAYEFLKKDLKTSAKILTEMSRDPRAGKWARLAVDRLKYHRATQQLLQWKNVLINRSADMQNSYGKYKNTSWLAIPVKLFRWTGYVKKMLKFNSAQRDTEKFQLWYENFGARFVPPVDICFDHFKVATDRNDDSAEVALHYQNSHAWYVRWKILNDARSSIDIQYFIVEKDIFGMSLQGLLLKKAKEGVKIRFTMDARGTKGFTHKLQGQDFIQELTAYPNVEVKIFNPIHANLVTAFLDPRKVMASNHDKIIVVDEEYAIVGGRNISMNYFVDAVDFPSAYRDCDVLIRSREVAGQLARAFGEEFAQIKSHSILKDLWGNIDVMSHEMNAAYYCMDSYLKGGKFYHPEKGAKKRTLRAVAKYNEELSHYKNQIYFESFDPFENSHQAAVKIIDKNSLAGPRNDITDQLVRFIDGSRREIIVQNPYVVLTERAFAALKRAGKRGVRVIVHSNSPKSTDSLATQAMFYGDWKKVLGEIPHARIFTYAGKRKLHAKTFLFDNQVSIIGTYNMDYISEKVNSEVVAAIKSKPFASDLRQGMMTDITKSKELKVEHLADGSLKGVFGPDQLPGKKMWLLKALARLRFLRPLT